MGAEMISILQWLGVEEWLDSIFRDNAESLMRYFVAAAWAWVVLMLLATWVLHKADKSAFINIVRERK
jgi:hypothetical protein